MARHTQIRLEFVISALLSVAAFVLRASACEDQTVRDAAFAEPRDVHRLCVIANAGDSAARQTYERLDAWLRGPGKGLNLELVRVMADGRGIEWSEFGLPSAPPSLPVAILAGRRSSERRSFFVDHWEPAPDAEDLAVLKTSPAREALQRELVKRLAVLLYVPAAGREEDRPAAVIDGVVKAWSKTQPLDVAMVRVDRSDTRERLLLAFIGAKGTEQDWVAVVFGRGKFMPPLVGREITEAGLNECLATLLKACTCLHWPSRLGVDIPMLWDETLDAAVVRLGAIGDGPGAKPDAPIIGRMNTPSPEGRLFAVTLWTLAALALGMGSATAAMIWRRRHGNVRSPRAEET